MSNSNFRINRRQLLRYAGVCASSAMAIPLVAVEKNKPPFKPDSLWISAHGDRVESQGVAWVVNGATGELAQSHSTLTGFRGHGLVRHPIRTNSVLMFSRRPGVSGIEIDLTSGQVINGFECAEGRHLFGHGCFSADGKILFTTESEFASGEGKIVVRDGVTYQLLDEWPSYGIGPHELKLMPDGNSLVVANGGILTHPNRGREALNLETMSSSLTYIDLSNGGSLDSFQLPEPKASIRHLDVASDGTVVFASQMQRAVAGHERAVALGGMQKPGAAISLFADPAEVIHQLNDYLGSVAVSNRSGVVGFASPRGNLAAFWQMDGGEFIGYHQLRDVCGIAVDHDQRNFVISNSFGELRELDALTLHENRTRRVQLPRFRWDNHLLALKPL